MEIYPDALACPDSFGNLPLNLAAKLHGQESYVFQVVSIKSQRLLQSREDAEDGEDITTVTTERTGTVSTSLPMVNGPSNDRPLTPLAPPRSQLQPVATTMSITQNAREEGWGHRPGTPTKIDRKLKTTAQQPSHAFVRRLQESAGAYTYSSSDDSAGVEYNDSKVENEFLSGTTPDQLVGHAHSYGDDDADAFDEDNNLEMYYYDFWLINTEHREPKTEMHARMLTNFIVCFRPSESIASQFIVAC